MELGKVESPKWRPEFTAEKCSQQLLHLDIDKILIAGNYKETEESSDGEATNLGDSEV